MKNLKLHLRRLLIVSVYIKIKPWRFSILNTKDFPVIYSWSLHFLKKIGYIITWSIVSVYLSKNISKISNAYISKSQRCYNVESAVYRGTIIRTGKACNKIPCYIPDSACRWFIIKKAKIFWSYVKHFWDLAGVRKYRILIGLCKKAFLNCPIMFLDWHNKTKLVPGSFSYF